MSYRPISKKVALRAFVGFLLLYAILAWALGHFMPNGIAIGISVVLTLLSYWPIRRWRYIKPVEPSTPDKK